MDFATGGATHSPSRSNEGRLDLRGSFISVHINSSPPLPARGMLDGTLTLFPFGSKYT